MMVGLAEQAVPVSAAGEGDEAVEGILRGRPLSSPELGNCSRRYSHPGRPVGQRAYPRDGSPSLRNFVHPP